MEVEIRSIKETSLNQDIIIEIENACRMIFFSLKHSRMQSNKKMWNWKLKWES